MKSTYDKAMARVLEDEGGYSNDAGDPGGPTKYGITIHDVRSYLKPNATAADVKKLTVTQAKDIYAKHYALPIRYDDLPAGVDYAVFDYGINSGVSRAVRLLQTLVHAHVDGKVGDETIKDTLAQDPKQLINKIYDGREKFLRGLSSFRIFGKGWMRRTSGGRKAALAMAQVSPPPMKVTPKKGFFSVLLGK